MDMLDCVGGEAPPAISALAYALEHNRVLQALNLNNCSLDVSSVETLAAGLRSNTSLLALRVNEGNSARTDAKMFLEPTEPAGPDRNAHRSATSVVERGHCWADGYQEVRFTFAVGHSGAYESTKQIYLHLECDEWRGDEMKPEIWKSDEPGADAAGARESVRRMGMHERHKESISRKRRSQRARKSQRMVCQITGATLHRAGVDVDVETNRKMGESESVLTPRDLVSTNPPERPHSERVREGPPKDKNLGEGIASCRPGASGTSSPRRAASCAPTTTSSPSTRGSSTGATTSTCPRGRGRSNCSTSRARGRGASGGPTSITWRR
jgi:hypothetical protein